MRDRILSALNKAKEQGKLDIVSAVIGIKEERLREIIKTKDMTTIEQSMLSMGL